MGITMQQARLFIAVSIPLTLAAFASSIAAVNYTMYYGILSAFAIGLSVGGGITFSDGILGISNTGGVVKLIGLGLLMVVSTILVILLFPANQNLANGIYYLDLTGQVAEIPFVFSVVAFLHTALLYTSNRRKHQRKERRSDF